ARPTEAGLDGVRGLVDVVAVEREARLQTQRVARPQADRLEPGVASCGEQRVPDRARVVVRDEDLESVFARVAGPGDGRVHDAVPIGMAEDVAPGDSERGQSAHGRTRLAIQ